MPHPQALYQHVKRPEWGFSTVVATQDDSTTFLFDDGKQRTITIGHVHLMQFVELLDDAAEEIHRKLARHKRVRAAAEVKRKRAKSSISPSSRPSSESSES